MCEYCRCVGYHDYRCPNAPEIISGKTCSYCSFPILPWEEYVENDDGEYIHYECIGSTYKLLDWLGYEVKTDEDED